MSVCFSVDFRLRFSILFDTVQMLIACSSSLFSVMLCALLSLSLPARPLFLPQKGFICLCYVFFVPLTLIDFIHHLVRMVYTFFHSNRSVRRPRSCLFRAVFATSFTSTSTVVQLSIRFAVSAPL